MSKMRVMFILIAVLLIMSGTAWAQTQATAEDNLKQKSITLPPPGEPVGTYVEVVRTGNLLFLSGHGPIAIAGGKIVAGPPASVGTPAKLDSPSSAKGSKVGQDLTAQQGYGSARLAGLNLLATARKELGSLNKVKRVVKVTAFVNVAPGFSDVAKVINGCSDLMIQVFGDTIGAHARTAIGVNELYGVPVEIEMILEVE